jgi:hypothetical protein
MPPLSRAAGVPSLHSLAPAMLGALLSFGAHAQAIQDTVVANGAQSVVRIDLNDRIAGKDYSASGITGSAFTTCKQASSGFYCLDTVSGVNGLYGWASASSKGAGTLQVACTALPGVDVRRATCTGMTANSEGPALWLAAKKNNTHSLFKLLPAGSPECSLSGWFAAGTAFCAREYAFGRPPLIDLDVIDAETGAAFPFGNGVLGLEDRKAAVFFADDPAVGPYSIASAKDWGLAGNEQILGVTLRQDRSTSPASNWILAVTTSGRVLQRAVLGATGTTEVFRIPAATTAACTSGTQNYELRASGKTGYVYLSDRNFCRVLALTTASTPFAIARTFATTGAAGSFPTGTPAPLPDSPPVGLSVFPGDTLDLAGACATAAGCGAALGADGTPAVTLKSVTVLPGPSGVTVFQVKGLPDCRWVDVATLPAALQAACAAAIVPTPGAPNVAATQSLNLTPLLPAEITKLYVGKTPPNGLPDLILPPYVRGAERFGYTIDALYVFPQRGIRYSGTFTTEFDVAKLKGTTEGSTRCLAPAGARLAQLLQWDVTATISEQFRTSGATYLGRLTNSGCGSIVTESDRLSLLPYTLELVPSTYAPTVLSPSSPQLVPNNDAVFARLVQRLYDDLEVLRRDFACRPGDGPDGTVNTTTQPLDAGTCSTLASTWANGKPKLDKCIAAAFDPKSSAGDENCQSFLSQLSNFRNSVPASVGTFDYANRGGALRARSSVIAHVFQTRFLPSIPAGGFVSEKSAPAP